MCFLTSTALAKDKVIGPEELTKRTSSDCVHGTRFKIDEDGTGDIFVAGCLEAVLVRKSSQGAAVVKYLIEVDVHTLELKVGRAIVAAQVRMIFSQSIQVYIHS